MANISRLVQTFPARVRQQAAANAHEAAAFLEAKIQDRLNRPYPPASRPGEAPARRSGRLRRETYCKAQTVGDSIVITAASPTPYADRLTRTGRIWLRPTIEANRAQVEQILLRKGFNNLERLHSGG